MAKASKGQQAAAAQYTQEHLTGQVRVDASNTTTGSKSRRSLSEMHPNAESAARALHAADFSDATITSPSGASVRYARAKSEAKTGGPEAYKVRGPQFGQSTAPAPRSGVSGAAPGEARWQVSQRPGQNAVERSVEQANAVRATKDPISQHGTLSVIRGLAESGADRGKVSRATAAVARRDPSAALALQGSVERTGAISRADTKARRARQRAAGAPSQDINSWSPNATQSTMDIRARSQQGYVHTQQPGSDISHEIRMNRLEHDQLRREAAVHPDPEIAGSLRHAAGAAIRGIGHMQAANRAAMTVNRRPMEETVGVQPAGTRGALPPGTSARTGRNAKRGTGHGY